MNISDVYAFQKVATLRSFTEAAREMGISRSTVSKHVSRLENSLGVMLLHRNTRCVNLTEAGRTLEREISGIDAAIEHAVEVVKNFDVDPQGTVAVSLPSAIGATLTGFLTTDFQSRWPGLELSLNFSDDYSDLIAEGFDLAVRICSSLPDSTLVARRIATTRSVVAASPGYLRQYGEPGRVSDLRRHFCIGMGSAVKSTAVWKFLEKGKQVEFSTRYALTANNILAIVIAARHDCGLINLPEICIADELASGQLVALRAFQPVSDHGVYVIFPHRKAAKKVKVVADFIEATLVNIACSGEMTEKNDEPRRAGNVDSDIEGRHTQAHTQ